MIMKTVSCKIKFLGTFDKGNNSEGNSLKIPWHHPNRSIRDHKIVNLFEGSAMDLLGNYTQGSRLVTNTSRFLEKGVNSKNAAKNFT